MADGSVRVVYSDEKHKCFDKFGNEIEGGD